MLDPKALTLTLSSGSQSEHPRVWTEQISNLTRERECVTFWFHPNQEVVSAQTALVHFGEKEVLFVMSQGVDYLFTCCPSSTCILLVNNGTLNLALYNTVNRCGNQPLLWKRQVRGFFFSLSPTSGVGASWKVAGWRPGRAGPKQGETSVRRRPCGDFTLLAVQMI